MNADARRYYCIYWILPILCPWQTICQANTYPSRNQVLFLQMPAVLPFCQCLTVVLSALSSMVYQSAGLSSHFARLLCPVLSVCPWTVHIRQYQLVELPKTLHLESPYIQTGCLS